MSAARSHARATVVVPTHDHAATLDLAVGSALAQTVEDLEVVIIGDGATDAVREVAAGLCRADDRVRAVWAPPSEGRGERARHEVVSAAAPVVTYLGDDDLLLPRHVEVVLELLRHSDFAHALPLSVTPGGRLLAHLGDLTEEASRAWHRRPGCNAVSLTGAAHTRAAYQRLDGWRPAPPGVWSDHHMWQQWLAEPTVCFAVADEPTVLKLDSSLRPGAGPRERRAELAAWASRLDDPGLTAELAALGLAAANRAGALERAAVARLSDLLADAGEQVARERGELERLGAVVAERDEQLQAAGHEVGRLGAVVAERDEQLQAAGREIEHLRVTRQQAADEVLRTRDERDARAAAVAALESAVAQERERRSAAEAELQRVEALLSHVRATRTWRARSAVGRVVRRLAR